VWRTTCSSPSALASPLPQLDTCSAIHPTIRPSHHITWPCHAASIVWHPCASPAQHAAAQNSHGGVLQHGPHFVQHVWARTCMKSILPLAASSASTARARMPSGLLVLL
jgi:hypothetical protein